MDSTPVVAATLVEPESEGNLVITTYLREVIGKRCAILARRDQYDWGDPTSLAAPSTGRQWTSERLPKLRPDATVDSNNDAPPTRA